MNFLESLKSSVSSVFANKMRSFLTMLGIIIGIGSVIMITSIGQGSQDMMMGEFNKLGVSVVTIRMKNPSTAKTRDFLTLDDTEVIRSHPEVKNVTPVFQSYGASVKLRNPKESRTAVLVGTNEEARYIEQYDILHGRFMVDADIKTQNQVVMIDDGLAMKIFGRTDVVGERISIEIWRGTYKFTVIGVMKNANAAFEAMFGDQYPSILYLPISTVQRMYGSTTIDNFIVSVEDPNRIDETSLELTKLLERKHHNEDAYYAENAMKSLEQINNILGILTGFISFVAGISLFVGGVGVMNIMLVTVTERTREIGIRKSLGATNKDIRIQFLIEAMILTAIGGTIGIILGYGGGFAIGSAMSITPKVSPTVVIGTVLISSTIGIVFGVYPANKAARLDPIEALRFE